MNWRERLADAISGGALTRAKNRTCEMALDALAADGQAQEAYEAQLAAQAALHSILTARNITEARKIARQALGEAE